MADNSTTAGGWFDFDLKDWLIKNVVPQPLQETATDVSNIMDEDSIKSLGLENYGQLLNAVTDGYSKEAKKLDETLAKAITEGNFEALSGLTALSNLLPKTVGAGIMAKLAGFITFFTDWLPDLPFIPSVSTLIKTAAAGSGLVVGKQLTDQMLGSKAIAMQLAKWAGGEKTAKAVEQRKIDHPEEFKGSGVSFHPFAAFDAAMAAYKAKDGSTPKALTTFFTTVLKPTSYTKEKGNDNVGAKDNQPPEKAKIAQKDSGTQSAESQPVEKANTPDSVTAVYNAWSAFKEAPDVTSGLKSAWNAFTHNTNEAPNPPAATVAGQPAQMQPQADG